VEIVAQNRLLDTAKPLLPDDILAKKDLQSGFWRKIFLRADKLNASDIHVECTKEALIVRCRVQGELCQVEAFIEERQGIRSLINRLKMICIMNLSIDDEVQDKSISFELTKSRYRIALSPTIFGENFVFRVIKDEFIPKLSDLFLPDKTLAHLRSCIVQRQGLLCITGPTGSGKSTTLQSILMELDRKKMKVITIENPVERIIPDTMQKEISEKVGWKTAIKMALREDPDVIHFFCIIDHVSIVEVSSSINTLTFVNDRISTVFPLAPCPFLPNSFIS